MNWNEQDYEAVGLFLDGQDVTLTEAQRELARQVSRDLQAVGPTLDVAIPLGMLHRVGSRIARPARTKLRRGLYIGLATSAAAAVVLLALMVRTHITNVRGEAMTPSEYVSAFLSGESDDQAQTQTQTLSDDVVLLQDELSSNDNFEQDLGDLERHMEQTE